MESRPYILVVDDEDALREGMAALLESEGYAVATARDGEAALASYRLRRPDLILLDVRMPRMNGCALCTAIRRRDPNTPILFLTACDQPADEVRGLSAGADDYISKTSREAVLLARIAAALRRRTQTEETPFPFGPWRVHPGRLALERPGHAARTITPRELKMLRLFSSRAHEVFSREALLDMLWGPGEGEDQTLTLALHRLRAKLGDAAHLIETRSGKGYCFRPS